MKAISIKQPYANAIVNGSKTVEFRSWRTNYRGPLVIASSQSPKIKPWGCAIGIVDLVDITHNGHEYEWILENPKKLASPIPRKGRLSIYDLPPDITRKIDEELNG
jgi:predicted transcriptional regulator